MVLSSHELHRGATAGEKCHPLKFNEGARSWPRLFRRRFSRVFERSLVLVETSKRYGKKGKVDVCDSLIAWEVFSSLARLC